MKVLLTQTIERTGIVGEVLEVSDGFARNFLLPKGLAIQPTEGNIKRLEAAKKAYEAEQRKLREDKEKLLAALAGVEVTVIRNANEEGHLFGSVSRRDIAEELQKAGHAVQPEDVKLDEPIRRVDTFTVPVALAADLRTEIKLWVMREKQEGEQGGEAGAEAGVEGAPAEAESATEAAAE
ncbi:MAG TPA: 50S ribosomal protein L9 [Phycisphaerae bacterium]|jgi:large subunit ribosomal protein L9|nr:50S ribosomal protein L9 [Phycisphaerae bacterium]